MLLRPFPSLNPKRAKADPDGSALARFELFFTAPLFVLMIPVLLLAGPDYAL